MLYTLSQGSAKVWRLQHIPFTLQEKILQIPIPKRLQCPTCSSWFRWLSPKGVLCILRLLYLGSLGCLLRRKLLGPSGPAAQPIRTFHQICTMFPERLAPDIHRPHNHHSRTPELCAAAIQPGCKAYTNVARRNFKWFTRQAHQRPRGMCALRVLRELYRELPHCYYAFTKWSTYYHERSQ